MANAPVPGTLPPSAGPTSSPDGSSASCPGCARPIDPLRAGHVAILGGRFRYFCRAACKQAYLRELGRPPEEDVATQRPSEVELVRTSDSPSSEVRPRFPAPAPEEPSPLPAREEAVFRPPPVAEAVSRPTLPSELVTPAPPALVLARTTEPPAPRAERSPRAARAVAYVEGIGIALGVLAPAVGLLGAAAEVTRLPLALAAVVALVTCLALVRRDPADAHPLVAGVPAVGTGVAAVWATVAVDPHETAILALAGLTSAVGIVGELLVTRARARIAAARERVERALDVPARVARGGETLLTAASEVRSGEPVLVEAGETVAVDGVVAAGEARVVPWLDAPAEVVKREGDPIVAGARVVSSRLRLSTTWAGADRAWVRHLSGAAARIDVAAPTPRGMRLAVERGSPLAALLLGLAAFAGNATPVQILAAMCAGAVAFGARAATSFVALGFARAHLDALACGIAYKDARSFERAGATNLAVLSARGTVLLGEPDVVAIEAIGAVDPDRVLALAAGAETASSHPFAAAILRAARARGVAPDAVRNAAVHDGLGVTASASSGERLVVGGRTIMLEEKLGVALAEARISELEAQGRSVLLVALGDRLVGVMALVDGLRPGARAAVQRLLDAHIEPALLSGEARDTCESIARALDIEHVRPEVLPADRGAEVRALSEGGSVVAVVGHPVWDDGALGAADVAVAMAAAGSTPREWSVALVGDDVRDAAAALAIAHAARDKARLAIVLGAAPGLAALLAIGLGVASPVVAPLAAVIGAVAVAAQAREPATPG